MAYENGVRRNHYADKLRHKQRQKARHMREWWTYFTTDFDTFCEYERNRDVWKDDKYYKGYWRNDFGLSGRRGFAKDCSHERARNRRRALSQFKGYTCEDIEQMDEDLVHINRPHHVMNKEFDYWWTID